jgi:hypothetical protein
MANQNINNFNTAFRSNGPVIEKQDYRNRNNLIHNNINENLLVEQIIEYTLNIDSMDRSLVAYPNPFNFSVTFGGHGPTVDKQTFVRKNVNISNKQNVDNFEVQNIKYEGTPGPVINRKFKNVKFFRLDYIILPKTNIIKLIDPSQNSISSSECILDSCLSTIDTDRLAKKYKYLVLRIREISCDNILGTNRYLENDTFILYPDKIMGSDHIMWLPTTGSRTYKNSSLENLNKLTFEILTPKGELLYVLDTNGNAVNINTLGDSQSCLKNCIEETIQCTIALILGVIENELNTNTKF